jgi:hypothetical protein
MLARKILLAIVPLLAFASEARAAATWVGPVQTYSCTNQVATALSSGGATTCSTVTAAMFGSSITAGTVFGNNTGSAGTPSFTAAPILGVPGTTSGTLELSDSAGGDVVLATGGNTTAYTLHFPTAAPVSNGQALTATTGGTASWSSIVSTKMTVSSKSGSTYQVATGTDDWTRFDNTGGSGGITFTLPTAANTSAGDNWCFTEVANQTVTVAVNSTQIITMGNTAGTTGTGTLTSGGVGSSVCMYAQSTTNIQVYSSNGSWTNN